MEKDHLAIILESIDNKFQLVLEGHASLANQIAAVDQKLTERADLTDFKIGALSDRIDGVEKSLNDKIDGVEKKLSDKIDSVEKNLGDKVDAVAADLKAHRADTEAHGNAGLYVVKEG